MYYIFNLYWENTFYIFIFYDKNITKQYYAIWILIKDTNILYPNIILLYYNILVCYTQYYNLIYY